MSIQEFARVLRSRWRVICGTIVVALLGAIAVTSLMTPLYESSTRLFISGQTPADAYQGNLLTQQRVNLYTKLLTGESLAQRTIDKLQLNTSAVALQARIRASPIGSADDTAPLIDVSVRDPSPVRARDIANTLSDEFIALVSDLETPSGDGAQPVRIVVEQRAPLPQEPVFPKASRNLAIGLAIGLMLGIGLALLRDLLDRTIKDGSALEEITGLSLVGSMPAEKARRAKPAIAFDDERSPAAEAFRKLRTNLQFFDVHHSPRVIVVTSAMPMEGKSTVAINIALALAEADQNVVLVDGDLRRPAINKYLQMHEGPGLSAVLAERTSLHGALQQTQFARLTVLTAGALPSNPSELLASGEVRKLWAELGANFDYVIVDSSALLAITDATILAATADGVLITARYGKTSRQQFGNAIQQLNYVGARLLGPVLTMTPSRDRTPSNDGYKYYANGSMPRPPRPTLAVELARRSPAAQANVESRSPVRHRRGGQ